MKKKKRNIKWIDSENLHKNLIEAINNNRNNEAYINRAFKMITMLRIKCDKKDTDKENLLQEEKLSKAKDEFEIMFLQLDDIFDHLSWLDYLIAKRLLKPILDNEKCDYIDQINQHLK